MKITFGGIVSYLVGIPLVLFGGLLWLLSSYAVIPVIIGLLILPPIRRRLNKHLGLEFSRGAVAGIGTFGVVALFVVVLIAAGASGGVAPGEDVSNVTVVAQDASHADADYELDVIWNSRTQSGVDPDPDSWTSYNPNDGEKFLVVRLEVTNIGEQEIELTPRLFNIRSEGVEYERQSLFGSGNTLSGVTVHQGGSHTGWIAYSVPEDMTDAELVVDQEALFRENASVSFTHDPEMAINMSD